MVNQLGHPQTTPNSVSYSELFSGASNMYKWNVLVSFLSLFIFPTYPLVNWIPRGKQPEGEREAIHIMDN